MAPTDRQELGRLLKRARKAAGYPNAHTFLAAVKDEQGSAPSYSSYAQWESGEVGPRDGSLETVEAFHRNRGTWVDVAPAPDLATALQALATELGALREERTTLARQVADLQATVDQLVASDLARRDSEARGARVPRQAKAE